MEYKGLMNRMQRIDLPAHSVHCNFKKCVYKVSGVCGDPRTSKGNSDAACFKKGNKEIYSFLEEIRDRKEAD